MKKLFLILLITVMTVTLCACGSSGGDGKSTCRNCGRSKPLSIMGYCSTCQEGFDEFHSR